MRLGTSGAQRAGVGFRSLGFALSKERNGRMPG